jgi:hypothetical protein
MLSVYAIALFHGALRGVARPCASGLPPDEALAYWTFLREVASRRHDRPAFPPARAPGRRRPGARRAASRSALAGSGAVADLADTHRVRSSNAVKANLDRAVRSNTFKLNGFWFNLRAF